MKKLSDELHRQMLAEIATCSQDHFSERAFRIAAKYWQSLREELKLHQFGSMLEEIDFFRNIKPQFLTESEYYSLLNYAESFCPAPNRLNDQKNFWIREMARLERFIDKNADFYMYYSSGLTNKDIIFFTRADADDRYYVFDAARSGYDKLAAQYLACIRYKAFAGEKVQAVMELL